MMMVDIEGLGSFEDGKLSDDFDRYSTFEGIDDILSGSSSDDDDDSGQVSSLKEQMRELESILSELDRYDSDDSLLEEEDDLGDEIMALERSEEMIRQEMESIDVVISKTGSRAFDQLELLTEKLDNLKTIQFGAHDTGEQMEGIQDYDLALQNNNGNDGPTLRSHHWLLSNPFHSESQNGVLDCENLLCPDVGLQALDYIFGSTPKQPHAIAVEVQSDVPLYPSDVQVLCVAGSPNSPIYNIANNALLSPPAPTTTEAVQVATAYPVQLATQESLYFPVENVQLLVPQHLFQSRKISSPLGTARSSKKCNLLSSNGVEKFEFPTSIPMIASSGDSADNVLTLSTHLRAGEKWHSGAEVPLDLLDVLACADSFMRRDVIYCSSTKAEVVFPDTGQKRNKKKDLKLDRNGHYSAQSPDEDDLSNGKRCACGEAIISCALKCHGCMETPDLSPNLPQLENKLDALLTQVSSDDVPTRQIVVTPSFPASPAPSLQHNHSPCYTFGMSGTMSSLNYSKTDKSDENVPVNDAWISPPSSDDVIIINQQRDQEEDVERNETVSDSPRLQPPSPEIPRQKTHDLSNKDYINELMGKLLNETVQSMKVVATDDESEERDIGKSEESSDLLIPLNSYEEDLRDRIIFSQDTQDTESDETSQNSILQPEDTEVGSKNVLEILVRSSSFGDGARVSDLTSRPTSEYGESENSDGDRSIVSQAKISNKITKSKTHDRVPDRVPTRISTAPPRSRRGRCTAFVCGEDADDEMDDFDQIDHHGSSSSSSSSIAERDLTMISETDEEDESMEMGYASSFSIAEDTIVTDDGASTERDFVPAFCTGNRQSFDSEDDSIYVDFTRTFNQSFISQGPIHSDDRYFSKSFETSSGMRRLNVDSDDDKYSYYHERNFLNGGHLSKIAIGREYAESILSSEASTTIDNDYNSYSDGDKMSISDYESNSCSYRRDDEEEVDCGVEMALDSSNYIAAYSESSEDVVMFVPVAAARTTTSNPPCDVVPEVSDVEPFFPSSLTNESEIEVVLERNNRPGVVSSPPTVDIIFGGSNSEDGVNSSLGDESSSFEVELVYNNVQSTSKVLIADGADDERIEKQPGAKKSSTSSSDVPPKQVLPSILKPSSLSSHSRQSMIDSKRERKSVSFSFEDNVSKSTHASRKELEDIIKKEPERVSEDEFWIKNSLSDTGASNHMTRSKNECIHEFDSIQKSQSDVDHPRVLRELNDNNENSENVQTNEQDILELNQQLLESFVNFDHVAYSKLVSDDMTCIDPKSNGEVVRGKTFHQYYFDFFGGRKKPVKVRMVGPTFRFLANEVAIVSYTRVDSVLDSGEHLATMLSETRVWEKKNGNWVNCHLHQSHMIGLDEDGAPSVYGRKTRGRR